VAAAHGLEPAADPALRFGTLSAEVVVAQGRMTPTTLLLHDESHEWVAFVREEDDGHGPLLRRALKARSQVCYLYAEDVVDAGGKQVVRIDVQDEGPGDLGW